MCIGKLTDFWKTHVNSVDKKLHHFKDISYKNVYMNIKVVLHEVYINITNNNEFINSTSIFVIETIF